MAAAQPIDALMGVKENVKPIKAGRANLEGVARAFGQPLSAAPNAEWEKRVAAAASTADPLAVWKECVGFALFLCAARRGCWRFCGARTVAFPPSRAPASRLP
jgi:hypothetical protein